MNKMLLSQIGVGQSGIVDEVIEQGLLSQRLLEMGIIKGVPIAVILFAPMGDPINIKVRGYYLSLRRAEAECIKVCL